MKKYRVKLSIGWATGRHIYLIQKRTMFVFWSTIKDCDSEESANFSCDALNRINI